MLASIYSWLSWSNRKSSSLVFVILKQPHNKISEKRIINEFDKVSNSVHAHIRVKMREEFKVDLFELARNGSGLREEE